MSTQKGKSLLIAGGVVALIVIAATAALLLFDINTFKSNIEAAVFDATGLEVKVKGKMGHSLFPFGISAQDVHVTGKGDEILSLENLKLGVAFMPLLMMRLKVTSCELVKPVVTIVKDAEGNYNFAGAERKVTKEGVKPVFSLHELKLSGGVLAYLDKKTGERTDLKGVNLTLKDFALGDTLGDAIRNASFTGTVDCGELLQKDVRIENLTATVKGVKGTYNVEALTIGALVKSDSRSGEKIAVKDVRLSVRDLSFGDISGGIIRNIAFTGNMECKEVRKKDLKIDNVKSQLKAEKGVFRFKPVTMDIFGAMGEGDVTLDASAAAAVYTINLKVPKLDFEKFEQSYGIKKVIGGKGDLAAALTMKEKGGRTLLGGTNGTFSLRGDNLVSHTVDLDKIFSSYESSQEFNLVDIGAFFIAGPLGNIALRGYHYGDFYNQTRGGHGTIRQFISHWKIRDGVAEATDCALATRHNRVAFKGRLDFVRERYDAVTVALLDDAGCAKFRQGISGSFASPRIGAVSATESIAGPIFDLYTKAKRFVQGGKCKVFYNGAVQQPPK